MVLNWVLFYLLHTTLAASKLKRILESKWPRSYKWYRLLYSVFSGVFFVGLLIQAVFLPVERIFSPNPFTQYAGYMVSTGGIIVLLRSVRQYSLNAFLGFQKAAASTEGTQLITSGIYSQIRHPLYLGLVGIFIGYFLVSGTLGALIHLSCLLAYLPVGIYYEEKNLISEFGESYRKYQTQVPVFFPKIHKKKG
jgi:protein-S-isoprenylcysteine O-methyltransferase Ste14